MEKRAVKKEKTSINFYFNMRRKNNMANFENIRPYAEFAHIAAQNGGVNNFLNKIAECNRSIGVMEGKKDELNWMYYEVSCKVVIAGPAVTPVQPAFVASYDENGRMLSFSIILNGGDSADVAKDPDIIKLFWVNSVGVSQCRNAEIKV